MESFYLLKTEPGEYSFADLQKDGKTVWDGVSNPTAVKNLREMKPGARLIIYETGDRRQAVGTASVVAVDAKDPTGRAVLVEFNFLGRVNQLAVHAAHHYWEVPLIGKLWCIHLQLLSYIAGVSGSGVRIQIPLPWCSASGAF